MVSLPTNVTFCGGQISTCLEAWKSLTSDPIILQIVKGEVIEFRDGPLINHGAFSPVFSSEEISVIDGEIQTLLDKQVITICGREEVEYFSPIFATSKADGGHRLILNLKHLNEEVVYHHFKMDSIKTVLQLVTQNCYMCKIDLKDAYYSVPVAPEFQRCLKFEWKDTLYKFVCLPNGLASCPRRFTKLLKVVLSVLRLQGVTICGYIDDFFIVAQQFQQSIASTAKVVSMFTNLGFYIHPIKSILEPKQEMEFLGFLINSVTMTVSLTHKKKAALKKLVNQLLTIHKPKIRFVAKVLGTMVAAFPASKYGPLYYRNIDMDKTMALKAQCGNFEASMILSSASVQELRWWKAHIDTMYNWITPPSIDSEMACDASDLAWGVDYFQCSGGGMGY